jgi:hypothetical protein
VTYAGEHQYRKTANFKCEQKGSVPDKLESRKMEHPFCGCREFAAIPSIDKDHANRLIWKMEIEAIHQS